MWKPAGQKSSEFPVASSEFGGKRSPISLPSPFLYSLQPESYSLLHFCLLSFAFSPFLRRSRRAGKQGSHTAFSQSLKDSLRR